MSNLTKSRIKSSWTPLTNEEANQKWKQQPTAKIFEERRDLVGKWFDKWTDEQRKLILKDLLEKCKTRQITFAGDIVNKKRPIQHDDFTRGLPRVLSLYILSFLDPRSLCRCSQVCWYWRYLTEVDQLWMPKCVKLGWVLSFSPNPYETGVWKRLYIENIMALKCLTPKVAKGLKVKDTNEALTSRSERPDSRSSKYTPRQSPNDSSKPPWRGPDPVAKDIWRNNILENDDEMEKVNKLRKKGFYGKEITEVSMRASNKVNSNVNPPKRPSSVPRSRSVPGLADSFGQRPDWAKTVPPGNNGVTFNLSQFSDMDPKAATLNGSLTDGVKRPSPVKAIKLAGKAHRTPRDPPSSNLFPEQPWKVPDDQDYDSDMY